METFAYRFDLDRDYFIDISMRYQSMLPFITLFTFRPFIFLILMKKRDSMPSDVRWAYIINQIALVAHEFNVCFLFRVHDLAPYSGLYCDGPICRLGIDEQLLMMLLALTTIGAVPSFLLLLLTRMHQTIIAYTDSPLKLSIKSQNRLTFVFATVLFANVPGFYYFGRDNERACELAEARSTFFTEKILLLQVPDLKWLKSRGGTMFLFGPPGQAQFFGNELLMLLGSILIILPFVIQTILHTLWIVYGLKFRKKLARRANRIQVRLATMFFLQILFTLESSLMSLILLLKNSAHRKIIKQAFVDFFRLFQNEHRLDRIQSIT